MQLPGRVVFCGCRCGLGRRPAGFRGGRSAGVPASHPLRAWSGRASNFGCREGRGVPPRRGLPHPALADGEVKPLFT